MRKIIAASLLLLPLTACFHASNDSAVTACRRESQPSLCMTQLALNDHTMAQNELGNMFFRGDGVPQNYAKAMYWYKKSALKGYAVAQSKVGRMYQNGEGVKESHVNAYAWYALTLDNNSHYFIGHDFKDLQQLMTQREIKRGNDLVARLRSRIEENLN